MRKTGRASLLLATLAGAPAVWLLTAQPAPPAAASAPLFTCDFESPGWYSEWGLDKPEPTLSTIAEEPALKFEPQGSNLGCNLQYRFLKRTGSEPEEIWMRYYLRFADDWDPAAQGGKLPGISGTYGRAGWGGRPVNGHDGWSARGLFSRFANGETPIGFYCYHVDMRGKYGSGWVWDRDRLGYLRNNRWYAIEQHVRLNSPGMHDGVLRAWIDGRLAFEKTDVRLRDTANLRIEAVWMNVYQGGTNPAASDDHLYLDDVAISRSPIGLAPR
jgi:hypothetical protein